MNPEELMEAARLMYALLDGYTVVRVNNKQYVRGESGCIELHNHMGFIVYDNNGHQVGSDTSLAGALKTAVAI